ncbi:MAG: MBL fold metallo-hydrolase [Bacteroidota bacterium]|nr:MBL fold metallo-hydrolase [Bacteroidota bacterium]
MKLTLTGTASGIPAAGRRHSAALLEADATMLLLDAGEGVSAALREAAIAPDSLTAVCITHTHADHVSGLPMLLQGLHLAGRQAPLDILVPPGREDWFRAWLTGMYVLPEKWSYPLHLHPLEERRFAEGRLRMLPIPNRHLDRVRDLAARHGIPAQCFSLRFEYGDESLLVSSDIAGIADVAVHAGRSDLLVVDATHVPMTEITDLADEYPSLRIVCTHIPPELEKELARTAADVADRYGQRIRFAYDGMSLELKREETWK